MLVITGSGRAGTSMIALWLKKLERLPYDSEFIPQFSAGYEPVDVSRLNSAIWLGNDPPFQSIPAQEQAIKGFNYSIIKDSKFFYGNVLNTWLSVRKDLKFLICLRKFSEVYKSRLNIRQLNQARKPDELEKDLGKFISQLVFNNIPFEFVYFPAFLDNYEEVYNKLHKLEPSLNIHYKNGEKIWNECVDKNIIHL